MKDNHDIDAETVSQTTNDALQQYAELARAAKRRKAVVPPDVDKEWAAFSHNMPAMDEPKPVHRTVWRTMRDVAIGAAAMFALMLTYNHYFNSSPQSPTDGKITAMRYDKKAQTVTLQRNNSKQNISGRDSISFVVSRDTATTAASSQATTTARVSPRRVGMQRLSTPRGMDFKVLLPDGSEVWLNAESTIEFPSAFTGSERIVKLRGEAYFKVARNEEQPFIVSTDRMSVKVLGTEFNLKSYTEETPHVSLVKGKVEVLNSDDGSVGACLRPGQDAWVDLQGSMHVREVDTYAVTQWVRGYFFFDDAQLVDILRELSRWYNCGVVFNNRAAMTCRLHFSASREGNLNQVIDNLNACSKAKIIIDGNDLVVN